MGIRYRASLVVTCEQAEKVFNLRKGSVKYFYINDGGDLCIAHEDRNKGAVEHTEGSLFHEVKYVSGARHEPSEGDRLADFFFGSTR